MILGGGMMFSMIGRMKERFLSLRSSEWDFLERLKAQIDIEEIGGDIRKYGKMIQAETAEYATKIPHNVRNRLVHLAGGGAAGVGLGLMLGGGAFGVVGLGMAVGIPVVLVTGLVGVVLADYGYREVYVLVSQWKRSLGRREKLEEQSAKSSDSVRVLSGAAAHQDFLYEALAGAQHSITIRSAFISDFVVNEKFRIAILDALERKVRVNIEYGYNFPGKKKGDPHRRAEEILRMIWKEARSHPGANFRVSVTPTHIKELCFDDRIIAIGSFNWLSNANRGSHANMEKSIVIEHHEYARQARKDAEDAADRLAMKKMRQQE